MFRLAACIFFCHAVGGLVIAQEVVGEPLTQVGKHSAPNIILMIGDGMGPSYITAYRHMQDDPATPAMEKTIFDRLHTGSVGTSPVDEDVNITDSAAAASAMSTGHKTYNGAIAVDVNQQPLPTLLERAREQGMATGIVTTTSIVHATPAAFMTHAPQRGEANEFADDYFDRRVGGRFLADVMLGGGTDYFVRADRNIASEFQGAGYSYVTSRSQMLADSNTTLLGLFGGDGIPAAAERDGTVPSLAEMTNSALDRLRRDEDGFFLVVEGGQIDWGGHGNDLFMAMTEMHDFAKAVRVAHRFAVANRNTILIVTADHATGGLSVGSNNKYKFDLGVFDQFRTTPRKILEMGIDAGNFAQVFARNVDLIFTDIENQKLVEISDKLSEAMANGSEQDKLDAVWQTFQFMNWFIDLRTGAGWTTPGHTGEDVPLMSFGPFRTSFSGYLENDELGRRLESLLTRRSALSRRAL